MNNNKEKKPLKHLKTIVVCGAFLLLICASISIFITETGAHAEHLDSTATAILGEDPTATPAPPSPTPTTPPPPSPTATATTPPQPTKTPTPRPTPTPKPPVMQPTTPVIQPTPTIATGGIFPPDSIPTVTATPPIGPTPTPGKSPTKTAATPTATSVATEDGSTPTTPTDDPEPAPEGGMNPLVMPIAIGAGIALLASIFLGIFLSKRPKGNKPLPFNRYSQPLAQTAQPTPWLNQSNANAAFARPGISANEQAAAATIVAPISQQSPNTPAPAMPQRAIPMPSNTQKTAAVTQAASFTGPHKAIAMPSNTQKRPAVSSTPSPSFGVGMGQVGIDAQPYADLLRPNVMPLSPSGAVFTQKNPVSTSDMNPLPLDNLDLSNMLPQTNRRNDSLWDAPTNTGKNQQAPSPVNAPSIQDDPILETIMRQAQMGIYAIADKSPSDPNDEISDAFLG